MQNQKAGGQAQVAALTREIRTAVAGRRVEVA